MSNRGIVVPYSPIVNPFSYDVLPTVVDVVKSSIARGCLCPEAEGVKRPRADDRISAPPDDPLRFRAYLDRYTDIAANAMAKIVAEQLDQAV